MRKGCGASITSLTIPLPRISPTRKLSKPCPLVLMEASLHRHKWLNHWPLVNEVNLLPLFPPRRSVGRTESSNPQITWLSPLATSLHLYVPSKSHLINVTNDTFITLIFRKFQDLTSSVTEIRTKTKYMFLIRSHNLTPNNRKLIQTQRRELRLWEVKGYN